MAHKIREIKGLDDAVRDKLETDGIMTVEQLLEQTNNGPRKGALAKKLGIPSSQLTELINRADLMRRIRQRGNFIGYSKNTKYPVGMLAPSDWIYTNKVLLIGMERDDLYAISLSTGFRAWLERFSGGNLGETLSLSISESVAKYPVPSSEVSRAGIDAAKRFNDLAVAFGAAHECGLTDVMNAIHTPGEEDATIVELRQLLVVIDNEVTAA